MAIIPKQIGWSETEKLYWEILKQLEQLVRISYVPTTTSTTTIFVPTTTTTTTIPPTTTTTTTEQTINDAMLSEDENVYLESEDETDIYLQLQSL